MKPEEIKLNEEIEKLFPAPKNYDEIKKDIEERGIQEPLVVNKKKELICGYTRLDIAKQLKIKDIPAREVEISDPLDMKEYAIKDNFHRRQMSQIEQVKLCGIPLEAIEKQKAKLRQKQGKVKLPGAEKGQTRDVVGEAVGMSGKTYESYKTILQKSSAFAQEMFERSELSKKAIEALCQLPKDRQDKILNTPRANLDAGHILWKVKHELNPTETKQTPEVKTVEKPELKPKKLMFSSLLDNNAITEISKLGSDDVYQFDIKDGECPWCKKPIKVEFGTFYADVKDKNYHPGTVTKKQEE